jgi:hypothetical protein
MSVDIKLLEMREEYGFFKKICLTKDELKKVEKLESEYPEELSIEDMVEIAEKVSLTCELE